MARAYTSNGTDADVQEAAGYFFARPGDLFAAIGSAVGGAYLALFQGSIYDFRRDDFLSAIKPLTQLKTSLVTKISMVGSRAANESNGIELILV